MDSVPPVPPAPPTTPDVQVVPPTPQPSKLPFNIKAIIPVIAMVAALPFLAKSVFIRQLIGSRAAYPNTYCVATFGCPTPPPTTPACPNTYGCVPTPTDKQLQLHPHHQPQPLALFPPILRARHRS